MGDEVFIQGERVFFLNTFLLKGSTNTVPIRDGKGNYPEDRRRFILGRDDTGSYLGYFGGECKIRVLHYISADGGMLGSILGMSSMRAVDYSLIGRCFDQK